MGGVTSFPLPDGPHRPRPPLPARDVRRPRTATAFQQALDLPARTLRASPARPIAGREWRTRLLPGVHAYYTSAGQRRFVMVRRLKYTEADT